MTEAVKLTADYVKQKFSGESTGHDWWHMFRVWQLAKTIAKGEEAVDLETVELGALLHDIADWKFHHGDMEAGPKAARQWLESIGVDEAKIVSIEDIIRNVSFKGAGVPSEMKTIEGKIIHDADKLDAIGAIGITRTFAYGGANNRPIYDPNIKPELHQNFESYSKGANPSINHFYEKLLLLKDRMFTKTGKSLAEDRHKFMEVFLEQFYAEWDGKR
jgi:uncharacterized protein